MDKGAFPKQSPGGLGQFKSSLGGSTVKHHQAKQSRQGRVAWFKGDGRIQDDTDDDFASFRNSEIDKFDCHLDFEDDFDKDNL